MDCKNDFNKVHACVSDCSNDIIVKHFENYEKMDPEKT